MVNAEEIKGGLDALRIFQEFTGLKLNYRARAKFLELHLNQHVQTRKRVFSRLRNEAGRSRKLKNVLQNLAVNNVIKWLRSSESEIERGAL